MTDRPPFAPGTNLALKIPAHLFDATVAFYRDVLGLETRPGPSGATVAFGAMTLWLDRVPTMTQPELWLEVRTADTAAAARWLEAGGVPRCDAVEPLPEGFDGFWIAAPGGVVHLVAAKAPPAG